MRVIGFDPGTNITGYGILEKKCEIFEYIDSGIIDLRKAKNIQQKLDIIYKEFFKLTKEYKPHSVAIEDVFVAKNTRGTIKLGYVKGIIFLAAEHAGLQVFEYSATKVKQAVTGFGRATKEEIRKILPNIIKNVKINNYPDATDAIAIAYSHIIHLDWIKNYDCIS